MPKIRDDKEIRVYVNKNIYTTIKLLSERFGVPMSAIIRAYIITCLSFKNYHNEGSLR